MLEQPFMLMMFSLQLVIAQSKIPSKAPIRHLSQLHPIKNQTRLTCKVKFDDNSID